jgi:hypothetical protein
MHRRCYISSAGKAAALFAHVPRCFVIAACSTRSCRLTPFPHLACTVVVHTHHSKPAAYQPLFLALLSYGDVQACLFGALPAS